MGSIGRRRDSHVSELLSAYLDNQLKKEQRAAVEEHLRTCAVCAADLQSLRATVRVLRAMPSVAVPRSFVLQPEMPPRRIWSLQPVLRLATAAVAASLVVVLAGDLLSQSYRPAAVPAPLATEALREVPSAAVSPVAGEAPSPIKAAVAAAPTQADQATAAPAASPLPPTATPLPATTLRQAPSPAPNLLGSASQEAGPLRAAPTPGLAASPAPAVTTSATMTAQVTPLEAAAPVAPTATTPAPPAVLRAEATPMPQPTPTAAAIALLSAPTPAALAPADEPSAPTTGAGLSLLRVVEIALLGLLVVLVSALVATRRMGR